MLTITTTINTSSWEFQGKVPAIEWPTKPLNFEAFLT